MDITEGEEIFEVIIHKNFYKINDRHQNTYLGNSKTPSWTNTHQNSIMNHITIRIQKIKDNKKTLKEARGKKNTLSREGKN